MTPTATYGITTTCAILARVPLLFGIVSTCNDWPQLHGRSRGPWNEGISRSGNAQTTLVRDCCLFVQLVTYIGRICQPYLLESKPDGQNWDLLKPPWFQRNKDSRISGYTYVKHYTYALWCNTDTCNSRRARHGDCVLEICIYWLIIA